MSLNTFQFDFQDVVYSKVVFLYTLSAPAPPTPSTANHPSAIFQRYLSNLCVADLNSYCIILVCVTKLGRLCLLENYIL